MSCAVRLVLRLQRPNGQNMCLLPCLFMVHMRLADLSRGRHGHELLNDHGLCKCAVLCDWELMLIAVGGMSHRILQGFEWHRGRWLCCGSCRPSFATSFAHFHFPSTCRIGRT